MSFSTHILWPGTPDEVRIHRTEVGPGSKVKCVAQSRHNDRDGGHRCLYRATVIITTSTGQGEGLFCTYHDPTNPRNLRR